MDAEVLTAIAGACRDHQRLRFDYRDHDGSASIRTVEPHRLVSDRGRWYLVAWDVDDRRTGAPSASTASCLRTPTGPRFAPRDLPDGDVAAYVQGGVTGTWRYQARVPVAAPAETIAGGSLPVGLVEAIDERTCILVTGADTPRCSPCTSGCWTPTSTSTPPTSWSSTPDAGRPVRPRGRGDGPADRVTASAPLDRDDGHRVGDVLEA